MNALKATDAMMEAALLAMEAVMELEILLIIKMVSVSVSVESAILLTTTAMNVSPMTTVSGILNSLSASTTTANLALLLITLLAEASISTLSATSKVLALNASKIPTVL